MHDESDRALLIYASKDGQTEKIARRIADRIREAGVMATTLAVGEVAKSSSLPASGAVLVAGPVHFGRHPKELERFVRSRREELGGRPATFLSVSGTAGAVDAEERAGARAYVDRFLEATGWRPEHVETVAGAVRYTRYNPILRWVMKRITVRAGRTEDTDTSRDYEYTDWDRVDAIADRIAREASARGTAAPAG